MENHTQEKAKKTLVEATVLFDKVEEKLKELSPLDKKEVVIRNISKDYGVALEKKDKSQLIKSCTTLYKFFKISYRKYPNLAEILKWRMRILYKKYLIEKNPSQTKLFS